MLPCLFQAEAAVLVGAEISVCALIWLFTVLEGLINSMAWAGLSWIARRI
jgi:hypothetical protein